jgi:hypothetical protein
MGAMRRAEGIVDVQIGQRGELPAKGGIVLFLAGVETHVLQQQDVAILQPGGQLFDFATDAIPGHGDWFAEELRQVRRHRGQTVFGVRRRFRTAEMRSENQSTTLLEDIAECWQRGGNAGVVGNPALVVEGDVEIDPAKNVFSF